MMPNLSWKKGSKAKWFSSLQDGFKITYQTIGPVQLTFLRLLSSAAYQNFTYTCINSVAWYNQQKFNYAYSLKLMGDNQQEFGIHTYRPFVSYDGCKSQSSNDKTVFQIRTNKLAQLPLVDFFPKDYGFPHQAFGFDVGPVCFS
ncbi:collagen alpha-1(III) chain-like [Tachypleus tridentatus]